MGIKILVLLGLIFGSLSLLSAEDFTGSMTWEKPPLGLYYQKKPMLHELWRSHPPVFQARGHYFGKLAIDAPTFGEAVQEPVQIHHLFWETKGGAPRQIWKEWESIPGYKRVPPTVYEYNQRTSPQKTRPRKPLYLFNRRGAILRYTEHFTYW